MASTSLTLSSKPSTENRLCASMLRPSRSKKKKMISEDESRRSKRFRSKTLKFWDFERVAVIHTDDGAKAAVIKDVPGEGTIILHDEDSADDGVDSAVTPKKSCFGNTAKNNESTSQPTSGNVSVATKTNLNKATSSSLQHNVLKSRLEISKNQHPKSAAKRSQHAKAVKKKVSASGAVGRRTLRPNSRLQQNESQVLPVVKPVVEPSQDLEGNEHNNAPVSDDSHAESANGSNDAAANAVLQPEHEDFENTNVQVKLRVLKLKPEALSINNHMNYQSSSECSGVESSLQIEPQIPTNEDAGKASLAKVQAAEQTNEAANRPEATNPFSSKMPRKAESFEVRQGNSNDAPAAAADPVRESGVFIKNKDLVFHGLNNSSEPATGEYTVAKGGAHGGVETFFLHVRKGYVGFIAPKNMKVFVVKGSGYCSMLKRGSPTLVQVLFKCAETNVEKDVTLMASVDDNCPELIICMLLYDSDTQPGSA